MPFSLSGTVMPQATLRRSLRTNDGGLTLCHVVYVYVGAIDRVVSLCLTSCNPLGKWRGCSSSPSSYSHLYVGSVYDDIRLHVAEKGLSADDVYTSSADNPFSFMSSFTLSNHLLLGLPLFLLPCTFITIALLPT